MSCTPRLVNKNPSRESKACFANVDYYTRLTRSAVRPLAIPGINKYTIRLLFLSSRVGKNIRRFHHSSGFTLNSCAFELRVYSSANRPLLYILSLRGLQIQYAIQLYKLDYTIPTETTIRNIKQETTKGCSGKTLAHAEQQINTAYSRTIQMWVAVLTLGGDKY